jgi:hypothetical protein
MGQTKMTNLRPPETKVSIVTSTNRPSFIENVFQNYRNQTGVQKELIIVLNNRMSIDLYKKKAKQFKNVFIYQLPEKISIR